MFWDPKKIQKSPETEATWRDSNSSTEHTIIPNLTIYNALLKTIEHLRMLCSNIPTNMLFGIPEKDLVWKYCIIQCIIVHYH